MLFRTSCIKLVKMFTAHSYIYIFATQQCNNEYVILGMNLDFMNIRQLHDNKILGMILDLFGNKNIEQQNSVIFTFRKSKIIIIFLKNHIFKELFMCLGCQFLNIL